MIDNATLEADSASSRSKMIFVVDDDRSACRELAGYLRHKGYFVTEIHDGITAITEIEEHKPALVVMDVRMPFCDGIRVADFARTLSPRTAVVLMSGFPDELVRAKQSHCDPLTVLAKPLSLKKVARVAAAVLEGRS